MKKLLAILISVLMLSTVAFAAEVKDVNMEVILNGQDITYEQGVKPLVRDDRIFVPVRVISEKCDYKVDWIKEAHEVKLTKGEQSTLMTVGSKDYLVNGEAKTMDVAPFIEGDRTYLPLRFLGEAMGLEVIWDDVHRIATIGFYGRDPELKEGEEEFVLEGTGMAINLPKEAKDQIVIKKTETGYQFFDKMHVDQSNQWGGLIADIALEDRVTTEVPHAVLGYQDGKYIMYIHVSDVNADISNKALSESYKKSDEMLWKIMESAHRVEEK